MWEGAGFLGYRMEWQIFGVLIYKVFANLYQFSH